MMVRKNFDISWIIIWFTINYGVSERVDCLAKSNTFISLNDQKSNFSSNPKCSLVNPAKSEIGKISKYFL